MGMELPHQAGGDDLFDNYSDSEVASHIREALKSASLGEGDGYSQLIDVIIKNDREILDHEAVLVTTLRALSKSVSCIDPVHHEALLYPIFHMSIWNYTTEVMDAYLQLMTCMAAASGELVDACLYTLVSNFSPPPGMKSLLKHPRGLAKKEQVLKSVHLTLHNIMGLVPLTPKRLEPILAQLMPKLPAAEIVTIVFVESLLKLESSVLGQFIRSSIFKTIIDRLVDLDVEIVLEPNNIDECSLKCIFDMELEDPDNDEEQEPQNLSNRQFLDSSDLANKLDSLMVLFCEHLKSCAGTGRLHEIFQIIMVCFENSILFTVKSKFAQFIVFYACSLDPENCGHKFAHRMLDIFFDKDKVAEIRMIAVSYLASYLSRGRFHSVSFIVSMLQRLVSWCAEYCRYREGEKKPVAHRVFYSACQAILYILCFHMSSAVDVPDLRARLVHLQLEYILKHPLCPLQVCLPSIVEEFLQQAKAACLFIVADTFMFSNLLESNFSKAFGGCDRLDMFFPFDPCLLKRTDKFIRPGYLYWSMVKMLYDVKSGSDKNGCLKSSEEVDVGVDGLSSDEDDNTSESSSSVQEVLDMEEFESSLKNMSITPISASRKDNCAKICL